MLEQRERSQWKGPAVARPVWLEQGERCKKEKRGGVHKVKGMSRADLVDAAVSE